MVRAVASRVSTRYRIPKNMAKEAAEEAARMVEVATSAEVPLTVRRVPTRASDYTNVADSGKFANVAMRPMGNSRRVFLLDPHLEAEDFEGLAHRIRALSKSEGVNSLLIATDDHVDYSTETSDNKGGNCLPRFVTQRKEINFSGISLDVDPAPDHTWYVSGGYDPVKIDTNDNYYIDYLLESLRKLAVAVQGVGTETKIPVISMPHGAVTDGGYALCMGSYVLATEESSVRILNPSRGLSFDPIGYSYILPRLGWEFNQESKNYSGCGMILALSGYEANSSDMIETGLATHLIGGSGILPILEEELATLPPWNQQGLVLKPRQMYGQNNSLHNQNHHQQQQNYLQQQLQSQRPTPNQFNDANGKFRNRSIALLMAQISDVSADSSNDFPFDFTSIYEDGCDDASLDTEHVPWGAGFFSSPLVDMAAELDDVFRQESSLEGLIERLKEVAARSDSKNDGDEDFSTPALAKELVERMERQSPLSLRVVYQLMKMGSSRKATMENCMAREGKAQRKLMKEPDFRNWLAHVQKFGGVEVKAPPFSAWKHSNVRAVTAEEVDQLIS
jgi:enoyl-CoA hydratase/carnithine racemase